MNILQGFQTMKHSRTRSRAPTLVVVLIMRNSLQFRIRELVERNVRRTRNLRIIALARNHIPYFEALKKMQGLFKSTENHILVCLLHLQLHAPLFRIQKHLHLTWFYSFLLLSFFSRDFFFWKQHVRACAHHVAWNLHYAHAH